MCEMQLLTVKYILFENVYVSAGRHSEYAFCDFRRSGVSLIVVSEKNKFAKERRENTHVTCVCVCVCANEDCQIGRIS